MSAVGGRALTVDPGRHLAYTHLNENTGGGPWVWEASGSEMDVLAIGGSPPAWPCMTRSVTFLSHVLSASLARLILVQSSTLGHKGKLRLLLWHLGSI